ncbi:MAG: uroporphyrinogen decarboxylase [Bacteroidota bacterium]
MGIADHVLMKVALGKEVSRPPVWAMRQAGRYLPQYMAVRKQAGSFKEMIAHPEWAAEVTLQPIELIGVDAAIIFSDILVVAEAMGLNYKLVPNKGPVFDQPIRNLSDLSSLRSISESDNLVDTYDAIRIVSRELHGKCPLIGFAGAPWTLFCYMTEGSGSKTFSHAKRLLYQNPAGSHQLLSAITQATITYLKGQIEAGVNLIQVFDSWAGILSPTDFEEFSLPYIHKICSAIEEVPRIVFAKGAFYALEQLNDLPCEVIGLDWQTHPSFAKRFFPHKALQGNLDPNTLYAAPKEIKARTLQMLDAFPKGKHIANLGHGMYPDIHPDHLKAFVHTVQDYSY